MVNDEGPFLNPVPYDIPDIRISDLRDTDKKREILYRSSSPWLKGPFLWK